LPVILYALFDERFPSSPYLELVKELPNYLEKRPDLYNYFLRYPLFTMRRYVINSNEVFGDGFFGDSFRVSYAS